MRGTAQTIATIIASAVFVAIMLLITSTNTHAGGFDVFNPEHQPGSVGGWSPDGMDELFSNQPTGAANMGPAQAFMLWVIIMIAALKLFQKMDGLVQKLGLNVANTGGRALGAVMMVGMAAKMGMNSLRNLRNSGGGGGSNKPSVTNTTERGPGGISQQAVWTDGEGNKNSYKTNTANDGSIATTHSVTRVGSSLQEAGKAVQEATDGFGGKADGAVGMSRGSLTASSDTLGLRTGDAGESSSGTSTKSPHGGLPEPESMETIDKVPSHGDGTSIGEPNMETIDTVPSDESTYGGSDTFGFSDATVIDEPHMEIIDTAPFGSTPSGDAWDSGGYSGASDTDSDWSLEASGSPSGDIHGTVVSEPRMEMIDTSPAGVGEVAASVGTRNMVVAEPSAIPSSTGGDGTTPTSTSKPTPTSPPISASSSVGGGIGSAAHAQTDSIPTPITKTPITPHHLAPITPDTTQQLTAPASHHTATVLPEASASSASAVSSKHVESVRPADAGSAVSTDSVTHETDRGGGSSGYGGGSVKSEFGSVGSDVGHDSGLDSVDSHGHGGGIAESTSDYTSSGGVDTHAAAESAPSQYTPSAPTTSTEFVGSHSSHNAGEPVSSPTLHQDTTAHDALTARADSSQPQNMQPTSPDAHSAVHAASQSIDYTSSPTTTDAPHHAPTPSSPTPSNLNPKTHVVVPPTQPMSHSSGAAQPTAGPRHERSMSSARTAAHSKPVRAKKRRR